MGREGARKPVSLFFFASLLCDDHVLQRSPTSTDVWLMTEAIYANAASLTG